MAICVGIGLMALDMFMNPKPKEGPTSPKADAEANAPSASA
jgi:hypothetical protein